MLTTSYVSPEMKALDSKAKEAGVIILNELGVDPGYDHMTAMKSLTKFMPMEEKLMNSIRSVGLFVLQRHQIIRFDISFPGLQKE